MRVPAWTATAAGAIRPKLWVDFNELEGDSVWTSLLRGPWRVAAGDSVLAGDYEGNTCQGTITQVRFPIVYILLDLSTWEDAP